MMTKNTTDSLSEKIKILLKYLNQNLYGKEEAIRLALLSAVANESIFFMGPPGTAKSMISRRIAAAFKDFYKDDKFSTDGSGYFEYLMNEFSTPDEICGPVELSALNEKPSRYVRQTEGYLPSAKVAFLDEIWKSGPAILNTLLTIINEKKYHNGKIIEKVPLISLAAASNELPREEQNLDALWDRFILRVFVNPVQNEEDFYKVVDDGNSEIRPTQDQFNSLLQISEVEKWQEEIQKVELGDKAKAVITAIRKELTLLNQDEKHKGREAYYVSDRRWKKIVRILKTSAFLNGRNSVDLMDCSLIEYAIWNTDKQHDEVSGIVEKILKQNGISEDGNSLTDISDATDHFKDLVNETWYETIIEPAIPEKEKIEKVDGRNCYECTRDGSSEIWYVTVNAVNTSWNNYHRIYDSNKNYMQQSSFSKDGDKIVFSYNTYTINKTPKQPEKKYTQLKSLEPAAKKALLEAFDKEHYQPLLNKIKETIYALEDLRETSAVPFENNLFAEKKFSTTILEQIDNSIINLKKELRELKNLHTTYADDKKNVKTNFTVGEILLSDGTTKNAKEKVDKKDIIGRVCLLGNDDKTAYALAVKNFTEKTHNQAIEIAQNYGKKENLPAPYNSGWSLPTVEQWKTIFTNKDSIGIELAGECWASDSKNDTDAYLFNFEKNESDFNSKAHPFNVYLIRKLAL